ncbi:MAG TPA: cytochrome P450 [Chloroflexia bacterium]
MATATTPVRIPPGPPTLPLVGAVFSYMRNPLDFMLENYRRYGDVIRIDLLGIKGAALHGAEANRFVLVDNASNFLVEPLIDRVRARWIVGNGLLFIDDPQHKAQRRLMMPAFHRKRIEHYAEVMRDSTNEMLDKWRPGQVLDIGKQMHHLALVIAGRTLFSMDLGGSAHELGESVATIVKVVSNPLNIGLAQLPFDVLKVGEGATLRRALKRIDRTLRRIIVEHERSHTDTGDAVSMLVAARDEEGNRLSVEQIRDQLLTLFVAGHETSANALTWAFYLLAQHPQVTSRLLGELQGELKGAPPTVADLERLPYLEQVMKEVLRLYPPAPSANRTAKEDFEWKGYTIRKGEIVSYVPFVSHRMPTQFVDPEVFMPERWAPDFRPQPPQYAYIPFAVGPRSCIGAGFAQVEIKLVMAMLLQRFRLDLVPGQHIMATVRTTVQPEGRLLMRVQRQDGHAERSPASVTGNVVGAA